MSQQGVFPSESLRPSGRESRPLSRRSRHDRGRALVFSVASAACAIVLAIAGARMLPIVAGPWLIGGAVIAAMQTALFTLRTLGILRRNRWVHTAVFVMMAVSLIGAAFGARYVYVAGRTYDRRIEAIDLSGQTVADLTGLSQCYGLRTLNLNGTITSDFDEVGMCLGLTQLDVRNNETVTADVHDALATKLPGCKIAWSMPLFGQKFDSTSTEIDLTALTLSSEDIASVMASYPDRKFLYSLDIYGVHTDGQCTELDLRGAKVEGVEGLSRYLDLMPALMRVDLRGEITSKEDMDALTARYPGISFIFSFNFCGERVTTEDTAIDLKGKKVNSAQPFSDYAKYLTKLKSVDLRNTGIGIKERDALQAQFPALSVKFSFTMFGVKATNEDTTVILNGKKVGSVEAVEAYLPYLTKLTRLEMCDCGISNEDMAALRERYPDIKIVWKIKFGKWTLRTDATAFSTLLYSSNKYGFTSKTFEPLKYCTDLEALDLGHNHITDLSFMSGLTKIKILILACNRIEDITPIAGLDDLEYIELFSNKIRDFSPLTGKTKLLDANLNRNNIRSIDPLLTCTGLRRLFVGACGLSNAEVKKLSDTLPNCRVNIVSGEAPTSSGWRNHKRYQVVKEVFSTRVYRPFEQ